MSVSKVDSSVPVLIRQSGILSGRSARRPSLAAQFSVSLDFTLLRLTVSPIQHDFFAFMPTEVSCVAVGAQVLSRP